MEWDENEDPPREFDFDNILDAESLIDVCGGLVIIDDESQVVRLVHYTTEEFFKSSQGTIFPDAHMQISKICLAYLSFDVLTEDTWTILSKHPQDKYDLRFCDYAANFWGDHLRGKPEQELRELAMRFLSHQELLWKAFAPLLYKRGGILYWNDDKSRGFTALDGAAMFGLDTLVQLLLDQGFQAEAKYEKTPSTLFYAAWRGYESTAKLLLENGAIIDCEQSGVPILCAVIKRGDYNMAKLLLDRGAELEARDSRNRTALHYAMGSGIITLVALLLEMGAALESRDDFGRTSLYDAVVGGHEDIVRLLLNRGANPKVIDSRKETLLTWAAYHEDLNIMTLLLESEAELYGENENRKDALCIAVARSNLELAKLLLAKGARPDHNGYHGYSALDLARSKIERIGFKGLRKCPTGLSKEEELIWILNQVDRNR